MRKVMIIASVLVVILYVIASVFGYLGLVSQPEKLNFLTENSNILEIKYDNWAFNIAILGLLFTIFAAVPVNFIPAKDDIEGLLFKGKKMNGFTNLVVSVGMASL